MAIRVTADDFHDHLQARLDQRGVLQGKVEHVLHNGWEATEVKPGTRGKVFVFPYQREWQGRWYKEKEGAGYDKIVDTPHG